jgi:hypothetical protein
MFYKKAGVRGRLPDEYNGSDVGLGLAETGHAVAVLPLAAFSERFDALETFQDIALYDETTGAWEAFVLGHDVLKNGLDVIGRS